MRLTTKKISIYVLILLCSIVSPLHAEVTNDDWKNYLKRSCEPTLTGKSKRMFGERAFWAHVDASMEGWIVWFRTERPIEWCRAEYQGPKNHERMMQCYYNYKDQVEWLQRCKPLVIQLCRKAGGYC